MDIVGASIPGTIKFYLHRGVCMRVGARSDAGGIKKQGPGEKMER